MTVPISDRLSQLYVGNDINQRFDFTFRVFNQESESGIVVRQKTAVEFVTLDPSLYTVTLNQDSLGGYIDFITPPESNVYFYIAGSTPLNQLLDITNYDNFYPDAIERALDKLTALLQERSTQLDLEKQARILADIHYDSLATNRENLLNVKIEEINDIVNKKIDEAISNGAVSALAIVSLNNLLDLDNLIKWNGRTVYVKNVGIYEYSNGVWYPKKNGEVTIFDYFTQAERIEYSINPTMDLTAIIKRAFATGVKKLNFLDLQMRISLATNGSDTLASFTNGDIELYGNGAAFIDDTTHLMHGSVVALFTLNGDVSSFKSNINYIGKSVSLATEIGYRGATYVYSKGQNKNISLDLYIENLRYGILAGSYSTPSLGGHKGIRGKLRCKNVGYPIATYLADDIEMEITGEGFHRVHYIAGCNHARFRTQVKNYYIAPIPHFYTDALVSTGVSKGCTDCKTEAIDLGSSSYATNGYLCGISLSRVDNGIKYDGIYFDGYIKGTDTQAQKLGLFTIVSSVRSVQPSYPTNWNNTIELNNISIKGIIDRKQQTVEEHGFSDLYVSAVDDLSIAGERHFPKISNLNIDVDYFPGSGNKPRGFWLIMDGLTDQANIRLNAKNSGVNVFKTNTNSLVKFHDSNIVGVDTSNSSSLNSKMEFIDSFISNPSYLPLTNKRFVNTPIAGVYPSGVEIKTSVNEMLLNGSSVTWANAIPVNSHVVGISFLITESIVGTEGLFIGDDSTFNRFYNSTLVNAGTGVSISNATNIPFNTSGSTNLILRGRGSGGTQVPFTSGKVKIVVNYIEIPIPS